MTSLVAFLLVAFVGLMPDVVHSDLQPPSNSNCSFKVATCVRDFIVGIVSEELARPRTGPHDCAEIKQTVPESTSGVYTVFPNGNSPTYVYYDMQTLGGGWLVFQRRYGGYVDFYRYWNNYSSGFGEVDGEHWLGNRKLHALTSEKEYLLRVVLSDFEGNTRYAQYTGFKVASEEDRFTLSIGAYSGDAGDSLRRHNNRQFTTRDQRNDVHATANCAQQYKGAWWYEACHSSYLNGLYLGGEHESYADGIIWHGWKGYHYSMKTTVMMFRPM